MGLAEANRAIAEWARNKLPKDYIVGTRPIAKAMATQVQGKVPVLTGALQASVQAPSSCNPDGNGVGMGGADVVYADWIEFGGDRGRDLVPEGRYMYPTVEADFSRLGGSSRDRWPASINDSTGHPVSDSRLPTMSRGTHP